MRRAFSTHEKSVCILANSRQGDLIGSKIMKAVRTVNGKDDIRFFGYGG